MVLSCKSFRLVTGAAILVLSGGVTLGSGAVRAADATGCQDPVPLKRFEGSSLVACERRDFAEYELPAGRLLSWDYGAKRARFAAKLDIEGRVQKSIYFVPRGPTAAEVFRNYKLDLDAKGFRPIFEARGQELGADQGRIFESNGPGEQLFGYSPETSRFLSAVKDDGTRQTYVSLYVIDYQGGVHSKLKAEPGQVLVRLDTLVAGALEDRMQVVTASEMETSIRDTGRVTLYGILFDFNTADVKPESRPALDEIAAYLKADPARKLHVVGHTDAIGGFDFNIRLSQARASAVAAELIRSHGIGPERLRGNGVGALAPVATNATDEGRAKNRRVELVPMP
jgi:outer membrane protein OmpA-like peptidoglycan-associated protein